ncbi:MAG TPA: hypothetical protein DEA47_00365 [Peptococcaceae bacterium]|nr:MAG: hypothetical protein XD50_0384 [Clostridia bacterium 41_269]HBT19826.1 hypothetical protein [Peptococcaceae bacterium]
MEISVYGISLIPIIVGIVQLAKKFGFPTRFAPLLSLLLGFTAAFVYIAPGQPKEAVLLGLVMGLSAVGLYSGSKNTIRGLKM